MEIQLLNIKLTVCTAYRPPNTNEKKFNAAFLKLLDCIKKRSKYSLIGLDHNLDLLKSDSHKLTQLFLENILSTSHVPCITRPTRITKSSATLIDNILVSREIYNSINCGIVLSDLSDHFPCVMTWPNIIKNKKDSISFETSKLVKNCMSNIKEELTGNWTPIVNEPDVNKSYQLFHDRLSNALKKYTEDKVVQIPYKKIIKEPWLTKGIVNSNRKQLKLYKDWLTNKNATLYDRYKHYRDALRKIKC